MALEETNLQVTASGNAATQLLELLIDPALGVLCLGILYIVPGFCVPYNVLG